MGLAKKNVDLTAMKKEQESQRSTLEANADGDGITHMTNEQASERTALEKKVDVGSTTLQIIAGAQSPTASRAEAERTSVVSNAKLRVAGLGHHEVTDDLMFP